MAYLDFPPPLNHTTVVFLLAVPHIRIYSTHARESIQGFVLFIFLFVFSFNSKLCSVWGVG